ncbi:MAG: PIN domain-containing protein [Defluviitaleaceae bacterium]|nr:PIN domain-containing protein [Defluviitaleaceae bacterium]MCL2274597.1 PIN domain-containing protein [Defluviitaleaceae bacterium]
MSDKVFLDTNILIYLYSEDEPNKRDIAYNYVNNADCVTSVQAMNEASNVWGKKYRLHKNEIMKYLNEIEKICEDVILVRRKTINHALEIQNVYGYSFYDCLMLASAVEMGCTIILTEDMQNGQVINDTLIITNPFIDS